MQWHIKTFADVRLDIVGLVAVLGEGSVTRNAQVSSLSWWSSVPRLLPAPQAFLEPERKRRLPTEPGIVVGAYSGTVKKELNFFTTLLHGDPPPDYVVELVLVERKAPSPNQKKPAKSFSAAEYGTLFCLAITGMAMSIALFVLAIVYDDAFGLLSVVTLSSVSSLVGFASHWSLAFKEYTPSAEPARGEVLPRSDVVIYYPNGAMRVVRVDDEGISRLYFQAEHCEYLLDDTSYRTLALFATFLLMAGVISLANATSKVQVAFAASYVLLNVLYWGASALNPARHHWKTEYKTETRYFKLMSDGAKLTKQSLATKGRSPTVDSTTQRWKQSAQSRFTLWRDSLHPQRHPGLTQTIDPRATNFTAALWIAIFLTGTTQWLNEATAIAPVNPAWKAWLLAAESQIQLTGSEAELAAQAGHNYLDVSQFTPAPRIRTDMDKRVTVVDHEKHSKILIPQWDYQAALTRCLKTYRDEGLSQRRLVGDGGIDSDV